MRRAFLLLVVVVVVGCGAFEEGKSTGPDASVDAQESSTEAEAGSGFCAGFVPPLGEKAYCNDFDTGKPALEGFDDVSLTPGATITLDTTAYHRSAPASFVARIAANSVGCSYARSVKELGTLPILTRVAFDVRIGGNDTNGADGASYIVIETGSCGMIFSANDQKGQVHVQTAIEDAMFNMLTQFPRPNTWAHVEATIRAGVNQLEVRVDDMPAFASTVVLPAGCVTPTSKLQIRPGMHCESAAASPREVRLDNVVVVTSKD